MEGKSKILVGCGCLVALLALALLAAGAGWWWWTRTPQYSLQQARHAFETHDLQAFERYVDVDSLVDTSIDTLATEAAREGGGEAFGAAVALMFRGPLAAELKTQVRRSVEKGTSFEGRDPRRTRFEVGDIRRDGKLAMARVTTRTQRGPVEERLELELRLRQRDGRWQVFEIANLAQLWRQARERDQPSGARR